MLLLGRSTSKTGYLKLYCSETAYFSNWLTDRVWPKKKRSHPQLIHYDIQTPLEIARGKKKGTGRRGDREKKKDRQSTKYLESEERYGSRRCGNYIIIVVWKLLPGHPFNPPALHSLPGRYPVPPHYLGIYKSTCTILIIDRTRTVPTSQERRNRNNLNAEEADRDAACSK